MICAIQIHVLLTYLLTYVSVGLPSSIASKSNSTKHAYFNQCMDEVFISDLCSSAQTRSCQGLIFFNFGNTGVNLFNCMLMHF